MIKREDCSGCYNEEYHRGLGGSKKCWSFDSATYIKAMVVWANQVPPFKKSFKKMPSCYQSQYGAVVKPESLDDKGFWK